MIVFCSALLCSRISAVTDLWIATGCRNADTLKKLQETEKLLKERTEAAYVNLDISNEEREKGNQVSYYAQIHVNSLRSLILPDIQAKLLLPLPKDSAELHLRLTEHLIGTSA